MSSKQLVAVYGTLKHGESNHTMLASFNANKRCEQWVYGWHMIHAGGFPAAVPSNSKTERIWVEVYEVSALCLSALDVLEGVKFKHYERTVVPTISGRAWMYQWHPEHTLYYMDTRDWIPKVVSGVWSAGSKPIVFAQEKLFDQFEDSYQERMEAVMTGEDVELDDLGVTADIEEDSDGETAVAEIEAPEKGPFIEAEYNIPIPEDYDNADVSDPAF